jgi:hypothetical protein
MIRVRPVSQREMRGNRCLLLVFVGRMRCVGIWVMPDIGAAGDYEEAGEERDGGNGEHGDGSAETGTYLWGGAGGGIAAHAAALRVGCGSA